jgi:hypothetical protein
MRATPGPWKVFHKNKVIQVDGPGSVPIVSWPGFDNCDREISEHVANACLIASVHDLLFACQAALLAIQNLDPLNEHVKLTREIVEAAIVKAEAAE